MSGQAESNLVASCFPDRNKREPQISHRFVEPIPLEDIAKELEGHEEELVLVDRHRVTIENYGKPGVCYLVSPTHVYNEYTREAGILIKPRIIDLYSKIKENSSIAKLLKNVRAKITVKPKFQLNPMTYEGIPSVDRVVKETLENINIFQEDLDGQDKPVYDFMRINRFPTTTHIEEFNIAIGNDAVFDFLDRAYAEHSKTLGNEIFYYMINSTKK